MKKKNSFKSLFLVLALVLSLLVGSGNAFAKVTGPGNAKANGGNAWAIGQLGNTETINLVAINDFHGSVSEDIKSRNPGIAKIAGVINEMKKLNQTFFLSAGDNFQGTAISNLTHGEVVNEAFKLMDLKASAIGNHEYDWGTDWIEKWSTQGGYPFLASNIVYKATGEPVDYADPYMIQEVTLKSGKVVKIGYVGLATPETAYKTAAANVIDIDFTDPVKAATRWAKYLREVKKVDAVVALTHLGGSQNRDTGVITGEVYDLAMGAKGIDLILSGHSHQTIDGVVNGVQILQAYYVGRSLQVGQLTFNNRNRKLVKVEGYVYDIRSVMSTLPIDPKVDALVKEYETRLAPIFGVKIGENKQALAHAASTGLTPLGQWTAKSLATIGGTQIGLINGGGIREPLPAGDITMGTMYTLFPFDNTLVTLKITGAKLKEQIDNLLTADGAGAGQYYGVKVTFDGGKAKGSRITSFTPEDGTPVDPAAIYTLSILDFMYTGGDKYNFTGTTEVVDTFVPVRDALVNYIKMTGIIDYTFDPTAYVKQ